MHTNDLNCWQSLANICYSYVVHWSLIPVIKYTHMPVNKPFNEYFWRWLSKHRFRYVILSFFFFVFLYFSQNKGSVVRFLPPSRYIFKGTQTFSVLQNTANFRFSSLVYGLYAITRYWIFVVESPLTSDFFGSLSVVSRGSTVRHPVLRNHVQ